MQWKKPFRTLAAELVIVVMGVTIALWADGWVAERSDRAVERARLTALLENVRATIADVGESSEEAAGAAAALRDLVVLDPDPVESEEPRRLLLEGFFYAPAFHPELNVYQDLKSSGELALLTNPTLRSALSTMDGILERVALTQDDLSTVQQLNYDAYLIGRVDLRPLLGPHLEIDHESARAPLDLRFMSELEFKNLVLFKLDLVELQERAFRDAEAALYEVERAIRSQLEGET